MEGQHRQIRDVPVDKVRTVYPLAIVQEPSLGFWLAATLLVDAFGKRAEDTLWKLDVEVRPVVFMTVEELESIVEYVKAGDFTLAEFLRDKLGSDREQIICRPVPGPCFPSLPGAQAAQKRIYG